MENYPTQGILESGKILLVESGIQLKESRIRLIIRIQVSMTSTGTMIGRAHNLKGPGASNFHVPVSRRFHVSVGPTMLRVVASVCTYP